MPTPKQVREHFGNVMKAFEKLERALGRAHSAKVIDYPSGEYAAQAPCKSLYECHERIIATTEAQLAKAMREEIEIQNSKRGRRG